MRLGKRRGLHAFALTEHIHAVGFWDMHCDLGQAYEYADGAYRIEPEFSVLSGTEVTVAERVDFIVVGALDEIARLDSAFRPRLSEWHQPPAMEFARAAREHDVILILAHPFRPGKEAAKLGRQSYPLLHAIEIDGRDYGGEREVIALARDHHVALSGGSDAHFYLQVGIRSTIIPDDVVDYARVRAAFEQERTRVHAKPYARSIVELCQEVKRVAKSQAGIVEEAVA